MRDLKVKPFLTNISRAHNKLGVVGGYVDLFINDFGRHLIELIFTPPLIPIS